MSMAGVTPPPHEIILIDDGSPAGLPPDAVLPGRTRVLQLNQRRGKAGALNAALRAVATDIVVCIDADTEVCSTDWHRMLALFDDAKLGAITGREYADQLRKAIRAEVGAKRNDAAVKAVRAQLDGSGS